jgi:hypothetical protein
VLDIVPLWRFELGLPTIQGISKTLTPPNQVFAQKVSVGNQTIADEGEPIANWTKHFPTSSTVDTCSITMLESGGTKDYWNGFVYWSGWEQLVHSSDGNYGLPKQYWQTITVHSLDTGGNKRAKFEILEAWPTNIATFDFDGESSSALYLIVTIACTSVTFTRI